jgi:hypothetical protein
MKTEWLKHAMQLATTPEDGNRVFYSGSRKIITGVTLDFETFEDDLHIRDCGFTQSKLTILRRLYLQPESHELAKQLWERRVGQRKYGSVGFTCYNHLLKADPEKKSKRASVMGPCIQSVTLTYLKDHTVNIDAFYRTTEFFKKFPADLIFMRDTLLDGFSMVKGLNRVRFHFANVTCHPMYFVTLIPLIGVKPATKYLEQFKSNDRRFYDWTVKWTARYICDEYMRGIQKFAQSMRVRKDALDRILGPDLAYLQKYVRDNHPGYRNGYQEGEDDEDE